MACIAPICISLFSSSTFISSSKQSILIIYASVTGNAAKWADELGSILRSAANIRFVDACRVKINSPEGAEALDKIQSSSLNIFVSSTQGNGEVPSESRQFFSSLLEDNAHIWVNKQCAVLGFGSSAYPIFCGAAAQLLASLATNGAEQIVTPGQCDAVKGEASTFYNWVSCLAWQKSDEYDIRSNLHTLSPSPTKGGNSSGQVG